MSGHAVITFTDGTKCYSGPDCSRHSRKTVAESKNLNPKDFSEGLEKTLAAKQAEQAAAWDTIQSLQNISKKLNEEIEELNTAKFVALGDQDYEHDLPALQELVRLARHTAIAYKRENDWVDSFTPNAHLRKYGYVIEHDVPLGRLAFQYREPITRKIVDGVSRFAKATAAGREEVEIHVIDASGGLSGVVTVRVSGTDFTQGQVAVERYKRVTLETEVIPLKEALEHVATYYSSGGGDDSEDDFDSHDWGSDHP